MNCNKKYLLPVILISILLIIVLLWQFLGVWVVEDIGVDVTLKGGFSAERKEALCEQYGLMIPDHAVWIAGVYPVRFRESYVFIQFEFSLDEIPPTDENVADILLEDGKWGRCSDINTSYDWMKHATEVLKTDLVYNKHSVCREADFTHLFYRVDVDGTVQCCFVGWRPWKQIL